MRSSAIFLKRSWTIFVRGVETVVLVGLIGAVLEAVDDCGDIGSNVGRNRKGLVQALELTDNLQ